MLVWSNILETPNIWRLWKMKTGDSEITWIGYQKGHSEIREQAVRKFGDFEITPCVHINNILELFWVIYVLEFYVDLWHVTVSVCTVVCVCVCACAHLDVCVVYLNNMQALRPDPLSSSPAPHRNSDTLFWAVPAAAQTNLCGMYE